MGNIYAEELEKHWFLQRLSVVLVVVVNFICEIDSLHLCDVVGLASCEFQSELFYISLLLFTSTFFL
jgi:hypothetical protein